MSDMNPSVLFYEQAFLLLEEIEKAQERGELQDIADLIDKLTETITKFEETAGHSFVQYESVVETEPPLSEKSNRFWDAAEKDIGILQNQTDFLRAATISNHNIVSTGIINAQHENARVEGKLKSLQMYSQKHDDEDIIIFGDTFRSLDFVDLTMVPPDERPFLAFSGTVTLGKRQSFDLTPEAEIEIIEGASNGFLGNNQEIEDPATAPIDPETDDKYYVFKSESRDFRNLAFITDDNPDTWIEYESCFLTQEQLRPFNTSHFYEAVDEESTTLIDWALVPDQEILRLGLEFDLKQKQNLNSVEFAPYGLEDSNNYPVLVRKIQTSPNGTDWQRLFPTNVWVGTSVNLQAARTADNIIAHKALWTFESRHARYIRVYIEQHHPVHAHIGLVSWVNDQGRVVSDGPVPPLSDPTFYHDKFVVGGLYQKRDRVFGKRWAIGIRDIAIRQSRYGERSVIITKPLRVDGVVDRFALEDVHVEVPPEFPSNESWVRFFVSPDEGENWFPIAPITDAVQDIPQQISFNDPLPPALRERSVANHNTEDPVRSVRLKIELRRPADIDGATPIMRSYKARIRQRS